MTTADAQQNHVTILIRPSANSLSMILMTSVSTIAEELSAQSAGRAIHFLTVHCGVSLRVAVALEQL